MSVLTISTQSYKDQLAYNTFDLCFRIISRWKRNILYVIYFQKFKWLKGKKNQKGMKFSWQKIIKQNRNITKIGRKVFVVRGLVEK